MRKRGERTLVIHWTWIIRLPPFLLVQISNPVRTRLHMGQSPMVTLNLPLLMVKICTTQFDLDVERAKNWRFFYEILNFCLDFTNLFVQKLGCRNTVNSCYFLGYLFSWILWMDQTTNSSVNYNSSVNKNITKLKIQEIKYPGKCFFFFRIP